VPDSPSITSPKISPATGAIPEGRAKTARATSIHAKSIDHPNRVLPIPVMTTRINPAAMYVIHRMNIARAYFTIYKLDY
jgi:hypothetical protein